LHRRLGRQVARRDRLGDVCRRGQRLDGPVDRGGQPADLVAVARRGALAEVPAGDGLHDADGVLQRSGDAADQPGAGQDDHHQQAEAAGDQPCRPPPDQVVDGGFELGVGLRADLVQLLHRRGVLAVLLAEAAGGGLDLDWVASSGGEGRDELLVARLEVRLGRLVRRLGQHVAQRAGVKIIHVVIVPLFVRQLRGLAARDEALIVVGVVRGGQLHRERVGLDDG
jgi:hypothetical protein